MQGKLGFYIILLLTAFTLNAAAQAGTHEKRLKVGLVLGGGGAKGAAHAGALKAIEETGIPIDYIAGTSIGSIVGGLYSCGYRADSLQAMFRSQEWSSLLADRSDSLQNKLIAKHEDVTYILGYPVKRHGGNRNGKERGAVRGDSVVALLDAMIGNTDSISFDSLPIPFRCVAVDWNTMKEVVLGSGKLSTAMRASMAIPGAYKPVAIDSMVLVDGGMLNNLPVDVVRAMGADVVIAIDLTQNKHENRRERTHITEVLGIGGILNWADTRPDLVKYAENRKAADVYINPDLNGFGAASFKPKAIEEMIERGYDAAKEQKDAIRKLIE